jgi:hypothetical protein
MFKLGTMKTIKRQGERHSFLMTGNALNVLEPNLNLGERMALALFALV